jgi:hypothetical protein
MLALAQFASSGTTTLSVTVGAEAAIRFDTSNSPLSTVGTLFNNPFTGTTGFTYKIRTSKTGGTGNIQLQVTSDFSPSHNPHGIVSV